MLNKFATIRSLEDRLSLLVKLFLVAAALFAFQISWDWGITNTKNQAPLIINH